MSDSTIGLIGIVIFGLLLLAFEEYLFRKDGK